MPFVESLIFDLTVFILGAIPSVDTHNSSVAAGQSKGKRARDKLTKNSEKRCRTNATTSVKPTGAIDSTSRSASPNASSSALSAGVVTKPHPQPKPRPLHRPSYSECKIYLYHITIHFLATLSGAASNVAETPAVVPTPSTPLTLSTSNIPRTSPTPSLSMLMAVDDPEVVQAATISSFQNKYVSQYLCSIFSFRSQEMGVSIAQMPQADAMDTEMESVTNAIPSDDIPTTAGSTSAT